MVRLPYGISNFESLVKQGYLYVDRTPFLERMEMLNEKFLFFLRPRRFGKSLWVSVLQYYYGLEHQDKFEELFGSFYIGQQPTPLANSYMVLKFDFSGIDTDSREKTYRGFSSKVKQGVQQFLMKYGKYFSDAIHQSILTQSAPEMMIGSLFIHAQSSNIPSIYVVIDEYDHFTNELFSFRLTEFQEVVSENGYVRKFYEVIKTATQEGVVDRIFATGVAPVTLDSLTSGFNIGVNISISPSFNEMMGFTEVEVRQILTDIGVASSDMTPTMEEVRRWYNGYLFDVDGEHRMYNSDMVLYFAKEYQKRGKYPQSLLDTNISSDYGKIGRLFRLGGEESERWLLLQALLRGEEVSAQLTEQFSFARHFNKYDFLSLLFYMGLLTIQEANLSEVKLQIPNEVIRELYYQYFLEQIQQQMHVDIHTPDVNQHVLQLAKYNDPKPLITLLEKTLQQLSNRDWPGFGEKHLKSILIAYLYGAGIYHIQSEPEHEQQYPDLLLRRRPPYEPPYQFMIELKFLYKKDTDKADTIIAQGRTQLRSYLQAEEVKSLTNLRAWLWVFVGTEAVAVEEIG